MLTSNDTATTVTPTVLTGMQILRKGGFGVEAEVQGGFIVGKFRARVVRQAHYRLRAGYGGRVWGRGEFNTGKDA
jgi:hypothetical protein